MKIRLLKNCVLKDNELVFKEQEILEISYDNKIIYYDMLDKRINSYEVIITDDTKIIDYYI